MLYFYPRDFTSGCTIEAHGFQDALTDFQGHNCEIAAISADSVDDHESFCTSEGLGFTLLSDPDGAVSRDYGSWMAPYSLRHTFLIDPEGLRGHFGRVPTCRSCPGSVEHVDRRANS